MYLCEFFLDGDNGCLDVFCLQDETTFDNEFNCSEGVRLEEMQVAALFFLATIERRTGSLLIKSNFLKERKKIDWINCRQLFFLSFFYKCLCFCCSVEKEREKKNCCCTTV